MLNTNTTHRIQLGDKIYARLTMAGGKVTELMLDSVATMTELLSELRYCVRGQRGLCQLYLRNMTQGWSQQRPLMLYATRLSQPQPAPETPAQQPQRRMLFPWETH